MLRVAYPRDRPATAGASFNLLGFGATSMLGLSQHFAFQVDSLRPCDERFKQPFANAEDFGIGRSEARTSITSRSLLVMRADLGRSDLAQNSFLAVGCRPQRPHTTADHAGPVPSRAGMAATDAVLVAGPVSHGEGATNIAEIRLWLRVSGRLGPGGRLRVRGSAKRSEPRVALVWGFPWPLTLIAPLDLDYRPCSGYPHKRSWHLIRSGRARSVLGLTMGGRPRDPGARLGLG
jgi:hypothetical protein